MEKSVIKGQKRQSIKSQLLFIVMLNTPYYSLSSSLFSKNYTLSIYDVPAKLNRGEYEP